MSYLVIIGFFQIVNVIVREEEAVHEAVLEDEVLVAV